MTGHVLIVDDDQRMAETLTKVMTRRGSSGSRSTSGGRTRFLRNPASAASKLAECVYVLIPMTRVWCRGDVGIDHEGRARNAGAVASMMRLRTTRRTRTSRRRASDIRAAAGQLATPRAHRTPRPAGCRAEGRYDGNV
jgi:hypothetical protein